eukprot:CAMPEP_0180124060 /NCGR_PEP_ID=MMETSP0986-20121125/4447_1 /TAXON_ID=697907 /ORGANISM="non described non described, Strain CCMP2293" /LENGTH=148 /DNA_ID=CAMNT_0022063369 /DNA_START=601 /DNA_END=1047 /DNA_ORIENTATION=+
MPRLTSTASSIELFCAQCSAGPASAVPSAPSESATTSAHMALPKMAPAATPYFACCSGVCIRAMKFAWWSTGADGSALGSSSSPMKWIARQTTATVIGTAHRLLNTSPTARMVRGFGSSAPASSPAAPAPDAAAAPFCRFLAATACPL